MQAKKTHLTDSTGTAKEKEEETRQSRDTIECSTESCVNFFAVVHECTKYLWSLANSANTGGNSVIVSVLCTV